MWPNMLLAFLFFQPEAAAGTTDGPGRFDLAVDLRGWWTIYDQTGCDEYMAITGTSHFASGPAFCRSVLASGMTQTIWQDCLEMTISGQVAASPLHHMILNDEYLTDDWSQAGTPARWTSKIVQAGSQDSDAATPVVVFSPQGAGDGDARRYIDSAGHLVMSWTAVSGASSATFRLFFTKQADLPCQGYEPSSCANRSYTDGEGAAGWTPACCLADYGPHQPNPNQLGCSAAGASGGWRPSPGSLPTAFLLIGCVVAIQQQSGALI